MEISAKDISKILPHTRFSLIGRVQKVFWAKKKKYRQLNLFILFYCQIIAAIIFNFS